jgi:hypothetical protein
MVIAQDLRLEFRGDGHAQVLFGQRFENLDGGAGSLGEQNPDSGNRTNGSATSGVWKNRRWTASRLRPPGSATANHPAAVAVNRDASRFFAGSDNCGPARHERCGLGGWSDSACQPRVTSGADFMEFQRFDFRFGA